MADESGMPDMDAMFDSFLDDFEEKEGEALGASNDS